MKYLKLTTQSEFNQIKESDDTLPLVASYLTNIWYICTQYVDDILNKILDGAQGTQTQETNYVSLIDQILANYIVLSV